MNERWTFTREKRDKPKSHQRRSNVQQSNNNVSNIHHDVMVLITGQKEQFIRFYVPIVEAIKKQATSFIGLL